MQWVQTKHIHDSYRSYRRFKCNRCGTTAEVLLATDSDKALPEAWSLGRHEGWHICPGCQTRRMPLLPVLG